MGSPPTEVGRLENERLHQKRINRGFAIAACPVTLAEYRKFVVESQQKYIPNERYMPSERCPVMDISWKKAAAYCNYLSRKEGLPETEWCYEETGGQIRPAKNYLSRTGYRLPTEAEWEFACRASARTSFYFGESEDLLGKYAWYLLNSQDHTWPVGGKKPNDLGLFDMHGNTWCWCEDFGSPYPKARPGQIFDDVEDPLSILYDSNRVLRGGSFHYRASGLRSASRVPTLPLTDGGFRPARTLP